MRSRLVLPAPLAPSIDPGIFEAAGHYVYLSFHPEQKVLPQESAKANEIKWRQGSLRDTRNVSVYAPTYYVVPALGILMGQALDMTIVQSLMLSRLVTGLVAFFLICIAILTVRKGFGVFFVLLLLPMTLAQVGSTSQDAICMASAALCAALLSRVSPEFPQRSRRICLVLSVVLLVTLASARPPYIGLSLFYLYFAISFRAHAFFVVECCIAFLTTWLATLLWSLYVALYVSVPFGLDGVNYAQQALFVLQSPLSWLGILAESWHQRWDFYLYSFIGLVGHLDTGFPRSYYFLTGTVLCLAFFTSFMSEKGAYFRELRKHALVPCLIVLATVTGIFLVLYISWSPVRNPVIEGVQGRYFIPAAFFLVLGTSGNALTGFSQVLYRCMVLAFAIDHPFRQYWW